MELNTNLERIIFVQKTITLSSPSSEIVVTFGVKTNTNSPKVIQLQTSLSEYWVTGYVIYTGSTGEIAIKMNKTIPAGTWLFNLIQMN